VLVTSPTRWSLRTALVGTRNPDFSTPFRSRARTGSSATPRPRRASAARLWNPTNSTPRVYPPNPPQERTSGRRDGTTGDNRAAVTVALHHPALGSPREHGGAPGDYPLLTLPEQRQNRHSGSVRGSLRGSLQVERSGSSTNSNRISLPRSVSIDISGSKSGERSPLSQTLDKGKGKAVEFQETSQSTLQEGRKVSGNRNRAYSIGRQPVPVQGLSFDKGKGIGDMTTDIERGPATQNPYHPGGKSSLPHNPNNASNGSLNSGIGPALSSRATSVNSWPEPPAEDEWGPQHPCYPHMNPHVPLSSPLYQTTRIIRIRRDWMLEGDLAPTFSNLYPEILDPAGVSEQEFRSLVDRVNKELIPAFNPWGARNIIDATLGLLTGWIWDDLGLTGVKARLQKVEQYLEEWNREMEIKGKDGPGSVPQIVSLRRTGYMNVR